MFTLFQRYVLTADIPNIIPTNTKVMQTGKTPQGPHNPEKNQGVGLG